MNLVRWCSSTMGVFGTLEYNRFECVTVELPWRNNQPSVSCIPDGTYTLRRDYYHTGRYEAFEICDVANRSRILIHAANTIDDIKGCVGVGRELGWVNDRWAVTNSRETLDRLMRELDGVDETTINIVWKHLP